MKYIFLIVSFILEGFISNFVNIDTLLFNNCFTLVSLFMINRYFINPKKYYLISFITGLIYDIVYTDKILINGYLFLLMSYLVVKTDKIFKDDVFSYILKMIMAIIIYRVLAYLIFIIIGEIDIDFLKLITSIISSIVLNLIYLVFILVLQEKSGRRVFKNKYSNCIWFFLIKKV